MTAPHREIELKFLIEREAMDVILAALPPGETTVKDMVAIYYDTADRWLGRAGFGLRVRRTGATRIQTLKSAQGADGGRDEWEWPVASDDADRALLDTTPAALPAEATLAPQFVVRTRRTVRRVREGDTEIELALDDGEVEAGGRRQAFLELELELLAGDPAGLEVLAGRLGRVARLTPSTVTKAGRGFRLLSGA